MYLQHLSNVQIIKFRHFFHKLAKTYPFRGRGFYTPVDCKTGYKVKDKQVVIRIVFVNTVINIYGNLRLKEISSWNSFEQIQENTLRDSAFPAQIGSAARRWLSYPTPVNYKKVLCEFMMNSWCGF